MIDIESGVLERFLRYVTYDTQSDPRADVSPSTQGQINFLILLAEECVAIGLSDVKISEHSIVTATLPSNLDTADIPVIGFISHVDTSPESSGANVKPLLFENYDGGDIVLGSGTVISPNEFPAMKNYTGQTIITASGDTLLGADDKSGIAIIMTAMEYLLQNPEIPHGEIRIAFTPDEEIGTGIDNFDVETFGANFGFTVDGGPLGNISFENFNAASAVIEVTGKGIHPGAAKGIMVNSALIAAEIVSAFPADDTPANSEGFEGFFHITNISGNVEKTEISLLIRCFESDEFEARKNFVTELIAAFNEQYGENTVKVSITDQYYNMREMIPAEIIEYAKAGYVAAGVEPIIYATRGGTDGVRLSFMGLPCPNIFTGGHNFHGPYEFIPLESMVKAVDVVVQLAMN
ncbi:MAG: peptidase T [Oscillospiraceae bacterium]|nr:peptidase T [Oscillospiraceae bacterium]